jgi:CRP-like cAMP-binding protein
MTKHNESLCENCILCSINLVRHVYKRGDILYHQGTARTGVFCINQGIVKVFTTDRNGSQIISHFASEGDLLGQGSNPQRPIHFNSAMALDNVSCCFLEMSHLKVLLKENPLLMFNMMVNLEKELSEAHDRNSNLINKNVRERLAYYFHSMKMKHGDFTSEGIRINVRLTREEIASYIGTAHETAIRFISEFKSLGLIKEEERFFYVLKPQDIAGLAGKESEEYLSPREMM